MKFIIDHIFLIGLVVISGGALVWPVLATRGKRASALQVTQMINRGKTTVLDVRDAKEFAEGHIRDAKNIPLAELSKRIAELDKSKNKTVVVVCQKGTRSGAAVKQLADAGFADALSLEGGIAAWSAQGSPLVK